jgi:hypothetical protein
MRDNREWCWAPSEDSEHWFGPFETRRAAIADANVNADEFPFAISRCNYADPADAAADWSGTLAPLESLHDHTDEELQDCDGGETYAYVDGTGELALEELSRFLSDWAKKHVKTRWFCCDDGAIEIVECTP